MGRVSNLSKMYNPQKKINTALGRELTPPIELPGEALELGTSVAKVSAHDERTKDAGIGVGNDEGLPVGHPRDDLLTFRIGQDHHELLGKGRLARHRLPTALLGTCAAGAGGNG